MDIFYNAIGLDLLLLCSYGDSYGISIDSRTNDVNDVTEENGD